MPISSSRDTTIPSEFGDSFDRPNMETARPYKCDFLKLRDKALGAFAR